MQKSDLKTNVQYYQKELGRLITQSLTESDKTIVDAIKKKMLFYQGKIEGYQECCQFIWEST